MYIKNYFIMSFSYCISKN